MIFKIAKCFAPGCTYRRHYETPPKTLPLCPKCGKPLRLMKNWYYSYTHMGKLTVKPGGTQKRLAEAALAQTKLDIQERRFLPNKIRETSWKAATTKFLEYVKPNVGPATYKMYSIGVRKLTPYLEHLTLDQITPADLEAFKRARMLDVTQRHGPPAPATINRELAAIKRLFAWAIEQQPALLVYNPMPLVKKLKEDNSRTRFLTEEEIATLLSCCTNHRVKMAVIIALETGLRKHGVMTLQWSDIQDGSITKKVKGKKKVFIPVTATLAVALADYRREHPVISPYVLPSPSRPNKPLRVEGDWRAFHRALERAGITDFRFHDLRHTFASHFLMRTGDLKTLQSILGHSDLRMTNRYTHLLDSHVRKQMALFDATRNGGSGE